MTGPRRITAGHIVLLVVAVNAVVTIAVWLHHGGLDTFDHPGGPSTALGELTALVGTYGVLVQLLLMSRIAWLERAIGFDRLAVWHRWTGFATVALLSGHVVFTTLGYSAEGDQSIPTQLGDFIQHYPDVLMATLAFGALLGIAISSLRMARQRLSRETWYAIHLYVYLAIALSFAHEFAVGADFIDDTAARVWWAALYVAAFGTILAWRVIMPIVFNHRHRLRVEAVEREADNIASIYVSGRQLHRIGAEPGQFFLWRFLTGTGWAKAHPFSLSTPPNNRHLRITVKDVGDDTHRLQHIRPGVRVFAEGPYGTFTAHRLRGRGVALIAGGIGITPLRALAETLPCDSRGVTLLYRAVHEREVAFTRELDALATQRGITVHYLIGPEIGDDDTDQLGIPALQALVPDIADRDVFVCGPPGMVDAVLHRLRSLKVARRQIHYERFAY